MRHEGKILTIMTAGAKRCLQRGAAVVGLAFVQRDGQTHNWLADKET